jgi:hypothetical protein
MLPLKRGKIPRYGPVSRVVAGVLATHRLYTDVQAKRPFGISGRQYMVYALHRSLRPESSVDQFVVKLLNLTPGSGHDSTPSAYVPASPKRLID